MKKLVLLMLIPAMLMTVSCNKMKEENARLKAKNDSLLALGFQKDTTVMEFVRAFNEIQSNLDSIQQVIQVLSGIPLPGGKYLPGDPPVAKDAE